ncbi:MAG: D-glycero-beta-D-manno-heptose 1-phosphate adenylyltransferase [Caulobacterales bacterium 32-67-6]|nr:MAG: D-glycero-beta-D-manno-heptose 1-phosphate adenylyltransferase [Caulobacterales bacterium 32-67-6]
MDLTALQHLLSTIPGVRVACVGDLMIDRFVYGEVTRVSPEAPIPVLARERELVMLGAAGNVARNVAALGGHVCLVGLVGGDNEGHEALRLVAAEAGVEGFVVTDAARPTTLKTRFVSGGQQLLRVDNEVAIPAQGDVGKGVVTPAVIAACRAAGARIIVDSKARSFARYGEVDIIKPNAAELAHATDMPTSTDDEVAAALIHALSLCEARAILVTRSAKGISLAVRGQPVRHFPGVPKEVFDASGAGDTTLAALGLALAANASIEDAAAFAMLASGVAVGKAGTAVVTPEELIEAALAAHQAPAEAKVCTPQKMVEMVSRWKSRGLRVGFTNGCFDILHKGHVAYLNQARGWCDRLIVGVNDDASVRRLKGEGRPVNDLESRAVVLAGLGAVDLVTPFDADTPIELIKLARPDVLIKGADYSEDQVVGAAEVRAWGGEVRLAQIVDGYSTTAALNRMQEKS